jgi:hypothetical protein
LQRRGETKSCRAFGKVMCPKAGHWDGNAMFSFPVCLLHKVVHIFVLVESSYVFLCIGYVDSSSVWLRCGSVKQCWVRFRPANVRHGLASASHGAASQSRGMVLLGFSGPRFSAVLSRVVKFGWRMSWMV